ncbi:MAG: nucleotidyltransferase family protein [Tannerella sp.]|jgi:NDP-sugar pyrophosphorylase family protein|nr:nucleotidyltransferase family protein [Tannerella sp.]
MKAMILAAGLGSRLKPLTDTTPKALVTVGGKTLLEHTLLRLRDAGFDRIVINIHHLGDRIRDFLDANGNFGIEITISDESDYLLDTGGGIKNARVFLDGDEPFLVHNVDIFTNANLRALYDDHTAAGAMATLLVNARQSARQLLFDKDNRLCGWRNRETGEVKSFYPEFDPARYVEYAFGGVHVISPAIFHVMDEWTGKFSIIDFYLSVCAKNVIRAFTTDELEIIDVGNHTTLAEAEKRLKNIF